MDDLIKKIENEVHVLKVNEEKLTEEQKNGKYKKALEKQRQKVVDAMLVLVNDWLPSGCRLKTERDAGAFCNGYNMYLDKNAENIKIVVRGILEHGNWEKVIDDLTPYQNEIFNQVYMPIFNSHNIDINGKIYNDLIGMFWIPKIECWGAKEGEGASFRLYPAPTELRNVA